MGDDHAGDAVAAGGAEQPHHRLAVHRVEGAGRLVGEEDVAVADDGAGDGDPLALAAGEVVGEPVGLVEHAEALERFEAGGPGPLRADAVELERERDVLERGEPGEEVEVLEHVADRPAPQRGPVVGRQAGQVVAVDEHLARRRLLHRTGDGEQRALARAARPHDGDERARRDVEVDGHEGIDAAGALAVGLGHAAQVDGAHRRLPTLRRSRSGVVRALADEARAGWSGA